MFWLIVCSLALYKIEQKSILPQKNKTNHLILQCPHPSPLARGFAGNKHFSKANTYLNNHGLGEIKW